MKSPDDRASIAKAYTLVSYVMSIALEMVVPGLLGYWLDHYLGTKLLFAVLGFAFGLTFGIWQLVLLGNKDSNLHRVIGDSRNSEHSQDADSPIEPVGDADDGQTLL